MRLFVYLFLLLLPLLSVAQPKGWQELTISDGLSQGMVFDIKQDRKGFIWIATKDGLNRYDGYNCKVFTPDTYNEYSLSDENCTALLVDRHGRLWVGTYNQGINLVDVKTDRFYHLNIRDQSADNAGNYEIRWMSEDPDGHLLVSTNKNKLFRITLPSALQTGYPATANFTREVKIEQFSLPANDFNGQVYGGITHAVYHPDGQATLGSTYGMYRFNWRHPEGLIPVNRVTGVNVRLDASSDISSGDYWFSATIKAIHGWYKGKHKVIPLAAASRNSPSTLVSIHAGLVAVFSEGLFWIMSPAELYNQSRLDVQNAVGRLPYTNTINCLLVDQTGLVWIGTAGYGLRKFNPVRDGFRSYLPGQTMSYLIQDRQKRTYVRHNYYFDEVDFAGNRLINMEDPPIGLPVPLKHYIIQDRKGDFYVLIDGDTPTHYDMLIYSSDWKLRKRIPVPDGIRTGDYVGTHALEDQQGQLWFGMANAQIMRFNPATDQFRVYNYSHLLPKGGVAAETYFLHVDRSSTLWICTSKGLIRMENPLATPRFSIYTKSKTDPNSLSHDAVSCVVDDPYEPDRYLWVSTKGGGLNKLEKQTGRFSHITEADGLPNKVVYGILVDDFRNFWMSTNRGIARYNPQSRVFHNYTKSDGLQDDEFNTASFLKSVTGELLFGGVNGLTIFNPRDFRTGSAIKPVARLIGLLVNNTPVKPGDNTGILPEDIAYTQRIDLDYDQNILTLEFGLSDYHNPAKNRYRYRLEGVNDEWVESGANRFANYTHLPDGMYTFEMIGSADGEVWSQPVTLQIRVHPPLYRTWWAYLCYILLTIMVLRQLYRFQRQRLLLRQQLIYEQQEASRLAELDSLKTHFFTNISHEFRTPLTLIIGPAEQLETQYGPDSRFTVLKQNANRLLRLINQLLDLSKLEAGQLKPDLRPGDLATFLRVLASSFTSLAGNRKIELTFQQEPENCFARFDRDKVEKIVTNLLSNAFKFTPKGGRVTMTVDYKEDWFFIYIRDSGIGMSSDVLPRIFDRFYQRPAQTGEGYPDRLYEGTGIGLALVKELVNVLDGTISVDSQEGVGTTFRLALPLLRSKADPLTREPDAAENVAGPVTDADLILPETALDTRSLPAEPRPQTDKVLLIIDDNSDIRTFIRSIFSGEYRILEAADGQEGLESATETIPDLVICDLMMPRLDGFGFCRALKSQAVTSHIPVIMLTARADQADRIEGFELGADEYLTKPFNQAEIRARVRNLLMKQVRLQQYFSQAVAVSLPAETGSASREEQFIGRVHQLIDENMTASSFGISQLSEAVGMSQSQLVRKLKALTNQTGVEFIRNRRLTVAADRLLSGEGVSDVAYGVGFESASYFSRVFQEKFGVLPSSYTGGSPPQV